MSKAIAPSPWAIRAFWLKSQLPLITTRALPITEDALIPELSHSREEVIFTNWYSIWKSPLTLIVRQCLERCQNQKSCKIEKLTAEFSDCASGVQEWLWTMQNSLSVSPFEICEIASWPFIYWERNSTPLIHYIWKISEPSPALTVKCYPCSTHLRLIEYLVINHSHWAKGQIQINTKYGIKWYQNHIMLWTIHKCNNLFFMKSTSSICPHRCIWRVKNNNFFPPANGSCSSLFHFRTNKNKTHQCLHHLCWDLQPTRWYYKSANAYWVSLCYSILLMK